MPRAQGNTSSKPPLSTTDVIFATPGRTCFYPSKIIFVAQLIAKDSDLEPKRAKWRSSRR